MVGPMNIKWTDRVNCSRAKPPLIVIHFMEKINKFFRVLMHHNDVYVYESKM